VIGKRRESPGARSLEEAVFQGQKFRNGKLHVWMLVIIVQDPLVGE
jgi:hypothetical protein